MRPIFPIDLQLLASLQRRPRAVRDDGNSAQRLEQKRRLRRIDRYGLLNAANRECVLVVDIANLSTDNRRMFDRRIHHPITIDVQTKWRLPCRNVVQIVNRALVADVLPFRLRFELETLRRWHRQLRRCGNQRAIRELSTARLVDHFVILSHTFRCRNLPLGSRSAYEHRAGGRTGAAERFIEVANGTRSVGILIAVFCVAEPLLDSTTIPIGFQFICRDERQ